MPELLKLTNIGLKGLSTDPQPWELSAEFLTYGLNFRVFAGAVSTSGGFQRWATAPAPFNPGYLLHVGATSGSYWLIAGRSGVYVYDGVTWSDISSAAGYASLNVDDELLWTGCMLGKIPVINNPQANPEYWDPQDPNVALKPLQFDPVNTWLDKGYTFQVLRSHRNFLFALNLQEGGEELPDAYRWSHPADINGLPFTWDETDRSGLAGRAALGGNGGRIIDGRSLRDAFAIYSENSINVLDYTGDEFVWRRRELSSTVGLLSRNSLIEVKGRHFFLADGDVVVNDGNSIDSITHNRIRRQLTAAISTDTYDRSYAVRNDALKEVWFCVPENGEVTPNLAFIYNWRDDSWVVRDLAPGVSFSNYGSQSAPTTKWSDFLDSETWDTQTRVWGAAAISPLDDTIVGVSSASSQLTLMDPSGTPDEDINTTLERTDYPLLDVREVTTITRIYPHIKGNQSVQIQFGSQDFPGAPVRWKPPVNFNPATQRKVDIRTTGELHCWRFNSVGKSNWTMSGMDIEFSRAGKR